MLCPKTDFQKLLITKYKKLHHEQTCECFKVCFKEYGTTLIFPHNMYRYWRKLPLISASAADTGLQLVDAQTRMSWN